MSEKFKNRYRISSARLPGWDYSRKGAYFITICTQPRFPFFGIIQNGKMMLSPIGETAKNRWLDIPTQFPNLRLDEFVIMPDHLHGILIIHRVVDGHNSNETLSEHPQGGFAGLKNPMLHNNISRVIRWYKGRCCFEIRKISIEFSWQPRFYDRLIRNPKEFERIRKYIRENPLRVNPKDPGNIT